MASEKHQSRKDKNLTIIKFNSQDLIKFEVIQEIVNVGYKKTGKKFNVNFQGSKGYLNHISIDCEGNTEQKYNRIYLEDFTQNHEIIIKYKNGNIKTFRLKK